MSMTIRVLVSASVCGGLLLAGTPAAATASAPVGDSAPVEIQAYATAADKAKYAAAVKKADSVYASAQKKAASVFNSAKAKADKALKAKESSVNARKKSATATFDKKYGAENTAKVKAIKDAFELQYAAPYRARVNASKATLNATAFKVAKDAFASSSSANADLNRLLQEYLDQYNSASSLQSDWASDYEDAKEEFYTEPLAAQAERHAANKAKHLTPAINSLTKEYGSYKSGTYATAVKKATSTKNASAKKAKGVRDAAVKAAKKKYL